jgi:hypothetical protein
MFELAPTVMLHVALVQRMLLLAPPVSVHVEPASHWVLHEFPQVPVQVACCEHNELPLPGLLNAHAPRAAQVQLASAGSQVH